MWFPCLSYLSQPAGAKLRQPGENSWKAARFKAYGGGRDGKESPHPLIFKAIPNRLSRVESQYLTPSPATGFSPLSSLFCKPWQASFIQYFRLLMDFEFNLEVGARLPKKLIVFLSLSPHPFMLYRAGYFRVAKCHNFALSSRLDRASEAA